MQHMVIFLGAHFKCDELVVGRAWRRLASRNEIGSRSAHGILYQIRDEEGEDQRYDPAQYRDVRFVAARLEDKGPGYDYAERDSTGVYEEPGFGGKSVL
jgi:hypothetical protein